MSLFSACFIACYTCFLEAKKSKKTKKNQQILGRSAGGLKHVEAVLP